MFNVPDLGRKALFMAPLLKTKNKGQKQPLSVLSLPAGAQAPAGRSTSPYSPRLLKNVFFWGPVPGSEQRAPVNNDAAH